MVAEDILVYSKGDLRSWANRGPEKEPIDRRWLERYATNIWKMNPETDKNGHPCPFPVKLPMNLIRFLSYQGDTVLDPFAGSGTTGVAAKRLGRNFIGCDMSQEYVDIANARIDAEPIDLFRKEE